MWWEPLQYSLNQLDLFDMRGCHFVMLPPLRGDNPGWEHKQQRRGCATMRQNKHLIAVHSFPFIASNKASDSSSRVDLCYTYLPNANSSHLNLSDNALLRSRTRVCNPFNQPENITKKKKKRILFRDGNTIWNIHVQQLRQQKSCREAATPMAHNKLPAVNCIWQVHTETVQTQDSRMTAGTRGNGERRRTSHWTWIYERVQTQVIHQRSHKASNAFVLRTHLNEKVSRGANSKEKPRGTSWETSKLLRFFLRGGEVRCHTVYGCHPQRQISTWFSLLIGVVMLWRRAAIIPEVPAVV